MRTISIVIAYAFLCSHLLLLFTWDPSYVTRHLFSIGAIITMIFFFKKYEVRSMRIWVSVLSIFFYFLFTLVYVVNGHIPLFHFLPPGAMM